MKKTRRALTAAPLCAVLLLGGCGAQSAAEESAAVETAPAAGTSSAFSERDLAGTYDEGEAVEIILTGGSFTIVSSGDCIDSNGDLTVTGGTLNLTCNGGGDTALDCDGSYTNSGGDVTTNDGSEENPGQMGGGRVGQPGDMGGERPEGQKGMR